MEIKDEDLEQVEMDAAATLKSEAVHIALKLRELRTLTVQECRSSLETIYWRDQINGSAIEPDFFQLHEEIEQVERNFAELFDVSEEDLK